MFANLPNAPDFNDVEGMVPIMDLDVSESPSDVRDAAGRREVDSWALKVQRMASVHSVTLLFVSITHEPAEISLKRKQDVGRLCSMSASRATPSG